MNTNDELIDEAPGIWSRIGLAAVAMLTVAFLFAAMSPALSVAQAADDDARDDDGVELATVDEDEDDDRFDRDGSGDGSGKSGDGSRKSGDGSKNSRDGTGKSEKGDGTGDTRSR